MRCRLRPHPITILALLATAASAPAQLAAQESSTFALTIPNIMRGDEVVGRMPERIRWSPDNRWIYFYWLPPGSDWRDPLAPYRVRAQAGAKPERLTDAQMDSAGPVVEPGSASHDGRLRAVAYQGDIYVVDLKTQTARRLTNTEAREADPQFGVGDDRVFFTRDDNVFAADLHTGLVQQLTDVRPGPAPKEDSANTPQRKALEADQKRLFQVIRDEYRADSIAKAEKTRAEGIRGKPLYLLKDERVSQLAVSPNGKAVLLITRINSDHSRSTEVPKWVTKSGYVEDLKGRDKVGDSQDSGRVALVTLPTGNARWLHAIPGDSIANPGLIRMLGWNDDGSRALLFTVRSDYKERYLETVADDGRMDTVDVLRDTAWIEGPCFGCGGWYDTGKRAWFVSEADGWAHIYTVRADGADRTQLTKGKWEVLDADLSPDKKWFWMHTSEPSPYERQFYRMAVTGGARERITTAKGGHDVTVSPNGQILADVYSTSNRPPELFVEPFRAGSSMAQLTVSPTKAWLSYHWIDPQIIQIPASDGVLVPARIYRPQDVGAQPNGAAVIFVHGAGYLHNVVDYWSSYYHEYMFNQLLATKGYVVLDEDYRGSAGYGRDWRVAVYRHMGGRDLQDEVDASRYLGSKFGIPPERVGIYGGSYGGFMTLMAMFTEPKHFGAGAALRAVTDWSHYNHWYTSRILNLPDKDTVAYHQSSPIYFAQGLEGPLLMCHGMVDTNVEFEDIVRLTERLIELGKTNWQLAPYPVENHGFVRPSSWTDEYSRIFALFDRTIGRAAPAVTTGAK
ncbi:MAG TPA: prolyl oligopeptidase family serine peptidase [Gemmatimonadaceae bacterium]|nr:prolyl oligopeptidase family serine peptidase [Gemmatimonadaceae bacterium]